MRPSVLMVGNFLSGSTGVRSVCEDLADRLRSRGWSVITTSHIKGRSRRMLDMLRTVASRRRDYDIAQVDVYSGPSFIWAEAVAASLAAFRCPFVLTLHGGNLPKFSEQHPKRVRRLLDSAAAVTSPSPYLQEKLKLYRRDIRVIPNGLDVAPYHVNMRTKPLPSLIWLRAFHSIYNPVLAVDVVSRLAGDFPDIRLLMVGPDKRDGSVDETRRRILARGLQDKVLVMGPVPKQEVQSTLRKADVFINTSDVDNAPVTVIEAMACGLCVVSTDVGGVPYLVSNERDGLLVPPNDPEAMAEAVRRVLLDPRLAARLSQHAREKAETFDWQKVIPMWEELLLSLPLSGRRS